MLRGRLFDEAWYYGWKGTNDFSNALAWEPVLLRSQLTDFIDSLSFNPAIILNIINILDAYNSRPGSLPGTAVYLPIYASRNWTGKKLLINAQQLGESPLGKLHLTQGAEKRSVIYYG